jgi:hypothetical protein
MMWRLGYHSLPMPGAHAGFGPAEGAAEADVPEPRLGLSVGFVHNRLSAAQLSYDQSAAFWLLPLMLNCLRASRRRIPSTETRKAA